MTDKSDGTSVRTGTVCPYCHCWYAGSHFDGCPVLLGLGPVPRKEFEELKKRVEMLEKKGAV